MTKFKQLAQDTVVRNVITEFIATQYTKNQLISETYQGVDPKSNLHYAIQLGEQIGKDIQIDMLCTYLNEHPVLKEDIFQRGLARTKAYLTTPLGRGFGDAKNQQMINNLFNTFKKNTDKIVGHGPNPFTPNEEDQKNAPARIQQISALFGKRFANIQTNPKLVKQPTSAEAQAGMGRIQQMLDQLRSSGFAKGADNVIDEIGIFARQHPILTNSIVAGLVAVMTLVAAPGWLAGLPLLKKWAIGTALRTLIGVLKGEKPSQAAAKGAAVSGTGIAIGKLLGLFYDQLSAWLSGPTDGSPLPVPQPTTSYQPVAQPVAMDVDTSNLGQEEYMSSYRGDLINKALNAASAEEYQTYIQQVKNLDGQFQFNGDIPPYDATSASGQLPVAPVAPVAPAQVSPGNVLPQQPTVTGVDIPQAPAPLNLTPKINALNSLISSTDVKGATAPAARTAVQNWVNGVTQPEAQAMLQNPNLVNQLTRKGALGMLKQKFGMNEVSVSKEQAELAYLKAELMGGAAALTLVNEANPFTTAKNFMFGGPKVGGDNSRLDYKQVESDYLKFLNNMEIQLGTKTEKDTLDSLKRYDKVFPGVYDYVSKVRTWLYGPGPTSNKPLPDAVVVPPNETPTPSNPNPDPAHPTDPKTIPSDPPKPGDPVASSGGYSNKNLAKFLTGLKGSPLFSGNLQQRVVNMLKASDKPNSPEAKAGMATLKTFLINFSKTISDASAQYRQKVGDPNAVRSEITKDPQFASLAEAAADLLAQNKDRQTFISEFTAAIPNLVGATAELRQVFYKKNPNSVYNFKATPPKLPMPAPTFTGAKMVPPVIGGKLPTGFAPKNEDLETRGNSVKPNQGAVGNLTGPDIANARAMFARLIDLGTILQGINPSSLDKARLKQLIINFLDIGDVLVYKKGSKKTNKAVDTALQGLDILGGTAGQPQQQASGFTPENKLVIYATKEDTGLLPSRIYQFFGGKWNIIAANGLQPLDPIGAKNAIIKLNQLAKAHRDDLDKVINLTKTNSKDKGAGVSSDVANQIKEMFGISDYKKFFV